MSNTFSILAIKYAVHTNYVLKSDSTFVRSTIIGYTGDNGKAIAFNFEDNRDGSNIDDSNPSLVTVFLPASEFDTHWTIVTKCFEQNHSAEIAIQDSPSGQILVSITGADFDS